jgi:hypothetical protein
VLNRARLERVALVINPKTAPYYDYYLRAAESLSRLWMWTFIFPHREGRVPMHGNAATREWAMVALAKSWRRE